MGTQSLVGLTMVYILSITSLLVVLLELTEAAPAPFLLDLLAPRITVRRQGKQIDDGYGVPEDSYGVPEEQVVESSSYDAPKPSYSTTTSTLPPCSYDLLLQQQLLLPHTVLLLLRIQEDFQIFLDLLEISSSLNPELKTSWNLESWEMDAYHLQ